MDQLYLNQQDPTAIDAQHRHFLRTVGYFGGHPHKSIKTFIKRVDTEKRVTNISSWETAKIVSESLLRHEAALEFQKYAISSDKFPNFNYWCEQPQVAAREKVIFRPSRAAKAAIQHVEAVEEIGVEGQPGHRAAKIGVVGQPAVEYDAGQPELPAIRAEPEVTREQCLKAYLLAAFDQALSIDAAAQHMMQYKTQSQNMSMRTYFNRLRIAMINYHSIKYTDVERNQDVYNQWINHDLMEAAKAGVIMSFKRYMEQSILS